MESAAKEKRIAWREVLVVTLVSTIWLLVVRAGPLSLPYFWDEADVYVAGARWLADHDMNPTPGHFPDDWSRGHPPLLYILGSIAFRLFGPSPVVGHALILPFAVAGLVSTYVIAYERASRAIAVLATLVLATTPLYLTMAAFLLPEMPLTGLTALALFFVHRRQLGWAAAMGILLVWIKETGIFTSGAIGAAIVFHHWRTGTLNTPLAKRAIALSTLPLFALIAFFLWQRINAGYFVFPHHQGLFSERQFTLSNFLTAIPSMFLWNGRFALSFVAVLCAVVVFRRPARPPLSRESAPYRGIPESPAQATLSTDPVFLASCLLALFNVVFFAQMFWLERYALPAHPGVILACSLLIFHTTDTPSQLRDLLRVTAYFLPILGGLVGLWFSPRAAAPELSFVYADVLESHQQAARAIRAEFQERALPIEALIVTTWPLTVELEDPVLGFTEVAFSTQHPEYLRDEDRDSVRAILIDTSSGRADALRTQAHEEGFTPEGTWTVGRAPRLELYVRAAP